MAGCSLSKPFPGHCGPAPDGLSPHVIVNCWRAGARVKLWTCTLSPWGMIFTQLYTISSPCLKMEEPGRKRREGGGPVGSHPASLWRRSMTLAVCCGVYISLVLVGEGVFLAECGSVIIAGKFSTSTDGCSGFCQKWKLLIHAGSLSSCRRCLFHCAHDNRRSTWMRRLV